MSVRTKMNCQMTEVTPDGEGGSVTLYPVTSGSPENDQFYKWTPGGSLKLSMINKRAFDQFVIGRSYYVDISPADEAVDSPPLEATTATPNPEPAAAELQPA